MDWRSVTGQVLDLDRDGVQTGHVFFPHSTDRSAYGSICVPLVSMRNGHGRTVLLMAGNHGDEWEGQIALRRLIQSLDLADLRGQILILPAAHYPAVYEGTRTSPLDNGNLNRAFPGAATGTITSRIAHFIETDLLPRCNLFLDLHSGGASLDYLPGLLAVGPDRQLDALIDSFAAPVTYVYDRLLGGDATSTGAAARQGVPKLGSELGGAGRLSRSGLAAAQDGILRVLSHLGVWVGTPPVAVGATTRYRVLPAKTYVNAPADGLFEPSAWLGDRVGAGQEAGWLHAVDAPWETPTKVCFSADGVVICQRPLVRVRRGDCLFHLGIEV